MIAQIVLAGFLAVVGLVWGLLRYEFGMPRGVALAFGGTLVLLGVIAAGIGQLAGMGPVAGVSGLALGVTATLSVLLALVS
ncbi:hypothetical protein [Natronoarchaeum rubrum]|uniref:hypothetical protein n=1 Tax=Natronoarchaeum rubrum TaxID=755311 RepID=UPI0021122E66|nr:hypothetical protein [Natronoarchaeum rubrum]